jgi:hypothetical protein
MLSAHWCDFLKDEQAWRRAARQAVRLCVLVDGMPVVEAIAEVIRIGRVNPGTAASEALRDIATEA